MQLAATEPGAGEALIYPFGGVPAAGQAVEVAPGVLWLRMRLPMLALNHINVWALQDGEGWTLVDTGMQLPDTAADWQNALAGTLAGRCCASYARTCIPITSAWPAGSRASTTVVCG